MTAQELFEKYSKNCSGYQEKFLNEEDFISALAEAIESGQLQPVVMTGGVSEAGTGIAAIEREIKEAKYKDDSLKVMGDYGRGFNDACNRFLNFIKSRVEV